MTKETIDEFLKRGGKIKKVDFSKAYERINRYRGKFIDYTKKKTKVEKEIDKIKNKTRR